MPGACSTARTLMCPTSASCSGPPADASANRTEVTAVRMPQQSSAKPIPLSAARPGSVNDATSPPAAIDIWRTPSAAPRRSAGNPWNTETVPATEISEPAMPESSRHTPSAATLGA